MPIPATSGPYGLLPEGRHPCTMSEVEQLFVTAAPFAAERGLVFDALSVWVRAVGVLLPGSKCWINGGFVTHKTWAAPEDADVVVFATEAQLAALTDQQQKQLDTLLTQHPSGGGRVQPMGGLVDGFLSVRNEPDNTIYWLHQWGRVRGSDRGEVHDVRKGFLEVVA